MADRHTACLVGLLLPVLALLVGGSAAAPAAASEVLVYYANESHPELLQTANYGRILAWLRASGDFRLEGRANQIEYDAVQFAKAVDAELEALGAAKARLRPDLRLVALTNRLARQGLFLVRDGADGFTSRKLEVRNTEGTDRQLSLTPLADQRTFARFLEQVATLYTPSDHEYLLVTKSHGDERMALAPRISAVTDGISQQDFSDYLARAESPLLSGSQARPAWARQRGTDKRTFLDILERMAAERGMRFTLVLMDSCHGPRGQARWDEPVSLPLYYFDPKHYSPNYPGIDYPAVLRRRLDGESLSKSIGYHLAQHQDYSRAH